MMPLPGPHPTFYFLRRLGYASSKGRLSVLISLYSHAEATQREDLAVGKSVTSHLIVPAPELTLAYAGDENLVFGSVTQRKD
jgi:hypothetical protein